jgi:hypothetical protein
MTQLAGALHRLTARIGAPVVVDPVAVADRSPYMPMRAPGLISANGSARLVRTRDEWMAVNLARPDDIELLPAWLECAVASAPWASVERVCAGNSARRLLTRARMIGLPVSILGETRAGRLLPRKIRMARPSKSPRTRPVAVVDMSSLWAGPLCGSVFADLGAEVTKVESRGRPDSDRESEIFTRFSQRKQLVTLDFANPADHDRLRRMILNADVVITSARRRAFDALGLAVRDIFACNPSLTWIAITGHGFAGRSADRVAFGDDAAAAGGLVRREADGEPRFFGDAPADPLTGLAAAVGGLEAVASGGGVLVDAALARVSAGVLNV